MQTEKRVIALGFFDGVHLGHGALLRRVGLEDKADSYPNQLSGGMQQRVVSAMGLSCGQIVLSVAVLAILITAPLGAIGMDMTYRRLLKRQE